MFITGRLRGWEEPAMTRLPSGWQILCPYAANVMLGYMPIPKNLMPMAGSCIIGIDLRTFRGGTSMTSEKVTHLVKWKINISRNWSPLYYFSGDRAEEAFPPYVIEVSAEFDHEDAVLEFKQEVLRSLEE